MWITALACNRTAVFSSWPYYNFGRSFLYLQFNNLPLGGVSYFPHVWTDFWVLNSGMKYLFASHVFVSNWIWMNGSTFACKTKLICVCVNLSWEGEMCCLPVHVDTTASICVQLLVFCVCIVCVCMCVGQALSPIYLQNGYVWPILPDFLALGKHTDSYSWRIVLEPGRDCWYLKEIWACLCLTFAVCLFDIDHKR